MATTQFILDYLRDLAAHNDRQWFAEHRADYDTAQQAFRAIVGDMKERIAAFDPAVAPVEVKDTLYRIYRDTRFSPDKAPYKRHLGSYINPRGKKSMHGGYYLHLQPGDNSCLAVGSYCLTPQVLRALRWSIVNEAERFHRIVSDSALADLHAVMGEERLKTCPAGFPRDFRYPDYLRPRIYDLFVPLPDAFFADSRWQERAADAFRTMKPFMDFVNETVDDYL